MTIKELREALARLPVEHDAKQVEVWLPGSTIRLEAQGAPDKTFLLPSGIHAGKVLIEGNLNPGSALILD